MVDILELNTLRGMRVLPVIPTLSAIPSSLWLYSDCFFVQRRTKFGNIRMAFGRSCAGIFGKYPGTSPRAVYCTRFI